MGLNNKELDTHVDAYSDRYRDAGSIPAASNARPEFFGIAIANFEKDYGVTHSRRLTSSLVVLWRF